MKTCTVAPFTGAWIEIFLGDPGKLRPRRSHPSRVRGLKSINAARPILQDLSHPSRVRGLKFAFILDERRIGLVAPFTGAWIEMMTSCKVLVASSRRTLHGCVD